MSRVERHQKRCRQLQAGCRPGRGGRSHADAANQDRVSERCRQRRRKLNGILPEKAANTARSAIPKCRKWSNSAICGRPISCGARVCRTGVPHPSCSSVRPRAPHPRRLSLRRRLPLVHGPLARLTASQAPISRGPKVQGILPPLARTHLRWAPNPRGQQPNPSNQFTMRVRAMARSINQGQPLRRGHLVHRRARPAAPGWTSRCWRQSNRRRKRQPSPSARRSARQRDHQVDAGAGFPRR